MESIERWRGAIFGLACGDALGMPVEFVDPLPESPVTDLMPGVKRWAMGGSQINVPAGAWTDDTSMTLCLAESLLESGGVDPADQMRRYQMWGEEAHLTPFGRTFGMGPTVRDALQRFVAGEQYWGDTVALTNGSLMRGAAVPLYFGASAKGVVAAAKCSDPTHRSPVCRAACQVFTVLTGRALRGASREELLSPGAGASGLTRPLPGRLERIVQADLSQRPASSVSGANDVECTLEAALWAFATTSDFESGAVAAVMLGLDADTTACVYGALAGAHYGLDSIPLRWREGVLKSELLLSFADRLHEAAN